MARKLIFLVALLLIVGVIVVKNSRADREKSRVLRVAFPYAKPASAYEPAQIHLAPEYIFLENIYSPLVEMSARDGQIEAGVAKSYFWKGNELHLVIRDDFKTVTGLLITAKDAEFSLKRLLAMPGNTHGNFKELICGSRDLKSIEDHCDGIRVERDELILKTTNAGMTFLLPMLGAIDFAVIPRSSVDPVTLKIIDFKNTSGPYYVFRDSASGKIELRANPNHFRYSAKIPQVIEFVPTDPKQPHGSLDDFEANRVDFITTVDAARADDVIAFSRNHADSTLHTTMNIRSFVLTFSQRGLSEISREDRFTIGRKIRESFVQSLSGRDGYEKSKQFFPMFSEGSLEPEVIESIDRSFSSMTASPSKNLKMTLVRLGDSGKFASIVRSAFPDFEIADAPKNPNFLKYDSMEDMPHMAITGPDAGFREDIGLITYSLNAGYFGMTTDERKAWLEQYMNEQDRTLRLKLLKVLHEKALAEPVIIPLLVAPYAALARKPWKIGLSQLFANNQLWLIQID